MTVFPSKPHAGRILNRFSSDTVLADDSLPFILNIFLANAAAILGVTTVLLICQPLLLVLYLPVAVLYTLLQACSRLQSLYCMESSESSARGHCGTGRKIIDCMKLPAEPDKCMYLSSLEGAERTGWQMLSSALQRADGEWA